MGLDLQIMVSHFRERKNELLPTTVMRCEREDAMLALFSANRADRIVSQLPEGLKVGIYGEQGLHFDDVDALFNPLTFTTPDNIPNNSTLSALDKPVISRWNLAILAYLRRLPDGTKIVLYWC